MILEALLDLSSGRRHSRYFNQTRSHFLFRRVRLIALLLAIIQPAWLAIDYLLLPADMFEPIAYCRAAAASACLVLGLWTQHRYRLKVSLLKLWLLIVILSIFQLVSSALLISHGHDTNVAGYHFFPFMIISMVAIFPLALTETFIYIAAVLCIEVLTQFFRQQLGSLHAINNLWLLCVLGIISGWAAINQLNMLLGLYRQATRDTLTGLANRRQALEQLEGELTRHQLPEHPLSVLLFDLDKFKLFNDTYGHAAGDIVLKSFAHILKKQSRRRADLPARYGGEEFLMILPGTTANDALAIAESIMEACRIAKVNTPSGDSIGFTTSIGIAEYQEKESCDQLIHRADEALYQAKAMGRDQACISEKNQYYTEVIA